MCFDDFGDFGVWIVMLVGWGRNLVGSDILG